MVHLAPVTPPTARPLISAFSRKPVHKIWACSDQEKHVQRRSVAFGLASVVLGLSTGGGNANSAARRPPPPPPQEKKDPNVSGVLAKVLASKKRKEAMKESIAKLKEKGKAIQEPSQ